MTKVTKMIIKIIAHAWQYAGFSQIRSHFMAFIFVHLRCQVFHLQCSHQLVRQNYMLISSRNTPKYNYRMAEVSVSYSGLYEECGGEISAGPPSSPSLYRSLNCVDCSSIILVFELLFVHKFTLSCNCSMCSSLQRSEDVAAHAQIRWYSFFLCVKLLCNFVIKVITC